MSGKIPSDAFDYYVSLGEKRGYTAVAEHYGVSKSGVVKAAARENWQERLRAIDEKARVAADEKLAETLEEIRSRHQKLLKAMGARAAKALQEFPLTSGWEGVKTAELVVKLERVLYGEPSDRQALTVEEVTRRELDALLGVEGDGEGEEDW